MLHWISFVDFNKYNISMDQIIQLLHYYSIKNRGFNHTTSLEEKSECTNK